MPVNKGLLLGAAFANGLNAFMDAREKGDLQRQRVALAQLEKQMKVAQLENLRTTGQMNQAKYDQFVATDPDVRGRARSESHRAEYEADRAGSLSRVAKGTERYLIDQQKYKTDEQEQIALTAAVKREIEESKRALQKFETSARTLGYVDATAMIEDYDDPKTTEFKKAHIRQSLGITTDAELRELVGTVANRLGEADISVKDAQKAYLEAGAGVRGKQAAWYEMRAKNADVITPTDAEILIGAGVDPADIPNKYSQLDYSQMNMLRDTDTGPYKFDQVVFENGKPGIIRYNQSDGTVEVVPIMKSAVSQMNQFKSEGGGEVGEEPLDASVDDGSETVELAPDTDDGNALQIMTREGIEWRAFEANPIIRRYREVNAHFKIITLSLIHI